PYPGFPLRPSTTYAAVVSRRVRATDGSPVARDADFEALLASGGGAVYAPLLDLADDLASATVFTTQDPTSLMGKLRTVVRAGPAPMPRSIVAKETTASYQVYEGVYDGPNFQSGDPPYTTSGGAIRVDAQGTPILDHMEVLR